MYTTPAKVREQLTYGAEDPSATAASLSDAVFDASIENMESIINGYLSARYPLPIVVVPEVLETIATDMVAYDVTMTFYQQAPIDNVDPVNIRNKNSRALLLDIARGIFILDIVDESGDDADSDDPIVINPVLGDQCPTRLIAMPVREVWPPW